MANESQYPDDNTAIHWQVALRDERIDAVRGFAKWLAHSGYLVAKRFDEDRIARECADTFLRFTRVLPPTSDADTEGADRE